MAGTASQPVQHLRSSFGGVHQRSVTQHAASYMRVSPIQAVPTIVARIGNAGDVTLGSGARVAFYDGDPARGGALLGGDWISCRPDSDYQFEPAAFLASA